MHKIKLISQSLLREQQKMNNIYLNLKQLLVQIVQRSVVLEFCLFFPEFKIT